MDSEEENARKVEARQQRLMPIPSAAEVRDGLRQRIADLEAVNAELVEACQASLAVMTGSCYGGTPGTTAAVGALRAAISKATGKGNP